MDCWKDGCDRIWSCQVEAAVVAIPTSILVASPPLTMGTVFPEWILYCPIEWPFRFLMGFTETGTRLKRSGGSSAARFGVDTQRRCVTLICFPVDLHLVGLHHLLNGLANVAQTHINTCKLKYMLLYFSSVNLRGAFYA